MATVPEMNAIVWPVTDDVGRFGARQYERVNEDPR